MKTPLVLFPAYGIDSGDLEHFARSLADRRLEDRILVICEPEAFSRISVVFPHVISDAFTDPPVLVNRVDRWRTAHRAEFTGVLGIDEELQFGVSRRLARRFRLPFHSVETCRIASNKYLQKRAWQDHGVPTGGFALIRSPDDPEVARIGFPNVLKIMSGIGSRYMFFNRDAGSFHRNFARLRTSVDASSPSTLLKRRTARIDGAAVALNPRRQFLVEEYIPGNEFSCDFMVEEGAVRLIRVVRKVQGPLFGFFGGYYLPDMPGLAAEGIDTEYLADLCRRIAGAMGVIRGVCMVDFKVDGGRYRILEASIRPGLSAFNHLMYIVCGYTSLSLAARQLMNEPLRIALPEVSGAVVYLYHTGTGYEADPYRNTPAVPARHYTVAATVLYEDTRNETSEENNDRAPDAGAAVPDTSGDPADRSGCLRGYMVLTHIRQNAVADLIHELRSKNSPGIECRTDVGPG
ncbi:MAG TPA: hypothetical protein PLV45_00860 [bacterium]|nr:hypothetical protein [bacterium]